MLDPVGPLDPAVYWRRRAVALVAIALAVLLIFWVASTIASAGGQRSGTAAESSASSATASAAPSGAAESGSSVADESSPEATEGSETTPSPAESSPAVTSDPAPAPVVCPVESVQVQVSANNNTFIKGEKPKLLLSVVNIGAQPCYRDLNAAGQELTVWDMAGTRLWSSNDCYPESSNDTRLLQPGEKVDFPVLWSGKVSEPTCTQPRPLLGPGQYFMLAAQDGILSAQVPFTIA